MGLGRDNRSKRWLFGSDRHKPKRRIMKVRGQDFRDAQESQSVKDFLDEAFARDEQLHRDGLIHP
jgi:hypothetical protein